MNWEEVNDFAKAVNEEIASYAMHFILNPDKMLADDFTVLESRVGCDRIRDRRH